MRGHFVAGDLVGAFRAAEPACLVVAVGANRSPHRFFVQPCLDEHHAIR